jgi:hypothetical protein
MGSYIPHLFHCEIIMSKQAWTRKDSLQGMKRKKGELLYELQYIAGDDRYKGYGHSDQKEMRRDGFPMNNDIRNMICVMNTASF